MLEDRAVEGTGSSLLEANGKSRAYGLFVRQEPCVTGDEFSLAYAFVGDPMTEDYLEDMREKFELSENYSAVRVHGDICGGMGFGLSYDSKGIVDALGHDYVIRGVIPSESLRIQMGMRNVLSGSEGIVFTDPDDFPGLNLKATD
ncbi:MAG: hypothetical protein ACI83O_000166 [Patescibacteria group bacterium]|jgi:hypothetical protein